MRGHGHCEVRESNTATGARKGQGGKDALAQAQGEQQLSGEPSCVTQNNGVPTEKMTKASHHARGWEGHKHDATHPSLHGEQDCKTYIG